MPARAAATPAKVLGNHPSDGKPIKAGKGRFGPYVQWGKTYASIPKSIDADSIALDQAIELIDAKVAKGGGKAGKAKPKAKSKPAADNAGDPAIAEKPKKPRAKKKVVSEQ